MSSIGHKDEQAVLHDFAQAILNKVDAEAQSKRRSLENIRENGQGNEFATKFRLYEDEIEQLREKVAKQKATIDSHEARLSQMTRQLHEEQEMTKRLMRNINELTENNQFEIQKERESLQSAAACQVALREDTIKDLKLELEDARAVAADSETQRRALSARIAQLETQLQNFTLNYVPKEDYERVVAEKVTQENQGFETENRLAIEMAKIATYEAQIERLKVASKMSCENENRFRLEIDQLNSKIISLNNEIKLLNSSRKGGSMQLPDEPRVSGNLDIEESAYNSIYFSRCEDDMSKKIEEMEKAHSEAQAQLKNKIKELIAANEALNNEVIRLKDQNNSIKADSVVLKRSSFQLSQRDISKVRRPEISEEVLQKMVDLEIQNKRLKEEGASLQKRLGEVVKLTAEQAALTYWAAVGFLQN